MVNPLLVVGMARSGTSLVAGMLEKLGFDLGPSGQLSEADSDNPDGYRERRDFAELNDQLKGVLGMLADPSVCLPSDWQEYLGANKFVDQIAIKARAIFGVSPYWLLKDPRISALIPVYLQALSDPSVLICVRNPADSARSFSKKFEVPERACCGLWLQHTLSSLHHSAGLRRCIVDYDRVVRDPEDLVKTILEMFPGLRASDSAKLAAIGQVRKDLIHDHSNPVDPREMSPSLIAEVYDLCLRAVQDRVKLNTGGFDREVSQLWSEFEAWSSINPAQLAMTTYFRASWETEGQAVIEARAYIPSSKPQILQLPINANDWTTVFGSLTHIPGSYHVLDIWAFDSSKNHLPVEVKASPDIQIKSEGSTTQWIIPRDGTHFMFRAPPKCKGIGIKIASSVSVNEVANLASQSYRSLVNLSHRSVRN